MSKKESLQKIEDCYEYSRSLNNWEVEFLDSRKAELINSDENVNLTNKQSECLKIIHEKCMKKNNSRRFE